MRQIILFLMIVSLAAVSCASKEKAGLDRDGVRKRADESHKSMGTY
jgi:hypothetical protein